MADPMQTSPPTPGDHEVLTLGPLQLFRHNYDGNWITITGTKKSYGPVHADALARVIEEFARKPISSERTTSIVWLYSHRQEGEG